MTIFIRIKNFNPKKLYISVPNIEKYYKKTLKLKFKANERKAEIIK